MVFLVRVIKPNVEWNGYVLLWLCFVIKAGLHNLVKDITNPSKLSPSVSDTDHLHLAAAAGSRCEHFPLHVDLIVVVDATGIS
ncbi:hypothetical protein ACSQ67_008647 [Phaseolus vulgaris]